MYKYVYSDIINNNFVIQQFQVRILFCVPMHRVSMCVCSEYRQTNYKLGTHCCLISEEK